MASLSLRKWSKSASVSLNTGSVGAQTLVPTRDKAIKNTTENIAKFWLRIWYNMGGSPWCWYEVPQHFTFHMSFSWILIGLFCRCHLSLKSFLIASRNCWLKATRTHKFSQTSLLLLFFFFLSRWRNAKRALLLDNGRVVSNIFFYLSIFLCKHCSSIQWISTGA